MNTKCQIALHVPMQITLLTWRKKNNLESQNHQDWKRPPRSPSPTTSPTLSFCKGTGILYTHTTWWKKKKKIQPHVTYYHHPALPLWHLLLQIQLSDTCLELWTQIQPCQRKLDSFNCSAGISAAYQGLPAAFCSNYLPTAYIT